jgi:hypothetical protein
MWLTVCKLHTSWAYRHVCAPGPGVGCVYMGDTSTYACADRVCLCGGCVGLVPGWDCCTGQAEGVTEERDYISAQCCVRTP